MKATILPTCLKQYRITPRALVAPVATLVAVLAATILLWPDPTPEESYIDPPDPPLFEVFETLPGDKTYSWYTDKRPVYFDKNTDKKFGVLIEWGTGKRIVFDTTDWEILPVRDFLYD